MPGILNAWGDWQNKFHDAMSWGMCLLQLPARTARMLSDPTPPPVRPHARTLTLHVCHARSLLVLQPFAQGPEAGVVVDPAAVATAFDHAEVGLGRARGLSNEVELGRARGLINKVKLPALLTEVTITERPRTQVSGTWCRNRDRGLGGGAKGGEVSKKVKAPG